MTTGPPLSLPELDGRFQAWLDERGASLERYKHEPADFEDKLDRLLALQRELFDAGWARHGWPEDCGGLGGSVLHRATVVDVLERNGFPPRHVFEHLDILPPALVRFGQPELIERLFLPTLRGDVLWCQGFSEPTAGSDLAALRTKASPVEGGYRVDGHKIWTSWAKWATHCLFLARTGRPEDRHRGLTAFVVETDAPGVTVGAIRQSNGSDELAEVFFDDVFVPEAARVGREGEGWAVAMAILAGERGSFTWLRQCEMLPRLERLAATPGAEVHVGRLGASLTRLIALRCRARDVMEILAAGREPGPESSVSKVLAIDAEQDFYDLAREVLSPGLDLGTAPETDFWQEHYLYSRASSVYGGSRQIQLNVIGKLMVSRGVTVSAEDARAEERETLRRNVGDSIAQSPDGRAALEGLDWWSFASAPADGFARDAFAAWFEGQGATPTTSPALAGVRARALAPLLDTTPDRIAWALAPAGAERSQGGAHALGGAHAEGAALLVIGLDAGTRWVAFDGDPAAGGKPRALPAEGLTVEPSAALDAALVRSVRGAEVAAAQPVPVDPAEHARALELARIAAACEILGAARVLLAKAIEHANEREQFGQPIARFQAVQHLISESQIELSTLESVCAAALEEWSAGDGAELARVVKVLAGRHGRSIAQRALQCFGAIGFTDEHPHHVYSRRIHTLDALFGSAAALERELGAGLVATGAAPRCMRPWHPQVD